MPKEISLDRLYPGKQKNAVKLEDTMSLGIDREITNGLLTIHVSPHGAELTSLKSDESGREYLWQADPAFWKRHSPVLFPIVGSVWEGKYRSKGKEYQLGQHGFARDMDFMLIEDEPDAEGNPQLLYVLRSSDTTLAKYPYLFRLEIGYRLIGRSVEVTWRVMNPSHEEDLKFQIGAHPAFYWPLLNNDEIKAGVEAQNAKLAQSTSRGFFKLGDNARTMKKTVITEKGCADPSLEASETLDAEGYLPLTTSSWDHDALIFENGLVQKVTLCGEDRKPYLTLESEAPLMGLWSPPGKNAPFVCIEPWYGRCDRVHYEGTYEEKDWIQTLKPLGVFEVKYRIVIE